MLDLWGVRMRDKNEIFSPNHLSLTESISKHVMLMIFVTNLFVRFFSSWPFLAKSTWFQDPLGTTPPLLQWGKCGKGVFPHVPLKFYAKKILNKIRRGLMPS